MEVLKQSPNCYVQHCKNCGAILKYGETDIYAANIQHRYLDKDGNKCAFSAVYDSFICPCCKSCNEAKRRFFYGEW